MRAAWALGLFLACGLATTGAVSACSSNDASGNGSGDDGGTDAPFDLCATFTDAGDPCPLISRTACFPECDNGGCFCLAGPDGKGRWECVTDLSCLPDSAPIDFDADLGDTSTGDDGGSATDANDGATTDASDAGVADGDAGASDDGGDGGDADVMDAADGE